ncbi:hypothetical protein NQZ68_004820, partial [Dissostichus eleginoides]
MTERSFCTSLVSSQLGGIALGGLRVEMSSGRLTSVNVKKEREGEGQGDERNESERRKRGGVAEKPLRDEDFSEVFQELYQTAK